MVWSAMNHPASAALARVACEYRGVPFDRRAIWLAIDNDDVLAAIFARLLYFTDHGRLPLVTQTAEATRWICVSGARASRSRTPGRATNTKLARSWGCRDLPRLKTPLLWVLGLAGC